MLLIIEMKKNQHTTVVLSEKSQEIKEDLAPVFGLKNILSAGLILLNMLDAEQQKAAIAFALGKLEKFSAENIVFEASVDAAKKKRKQYRRPSKSD